MSLSLRYVNLTTDVKHVHILYSQIWQESDILKLFPTVAAHKHTVCGCWKKKTLLTEWWRIQIRRSQIMSMSEHRSGYAELSPHTHTHARTHTHGQRHTWFYYDTRYSWMSDRLLLNSPSGIYKTPLSVYLWVICSLSASWCLQKWLLLVKQIYSTKYCGCNRTKLDPQINCGCEEKCRMWQDFWLFVLQEIHMLQKTNLINFIRVQTDISLYN